MWFFSLVLYFHFHILSMTYSLFCSKFRLNIKRSMVVEIVKVDEVSTIFVVVGSHNWMHVFSCDLAEFQWMQLYLVYIYLLVKLGCAWHCTLLCPMMQLYYSQWLVMGIMVPIVVHTLSQYGTTYLLFLDVFFILALQTYILRGCGFSSGVAQ